MQNLWRKEPVLRNMLGHIRTILTCCSLTMAVGAASAQSITVSEGSLTYSKAGIHRVLWSDPANLEASLSPDGKTVALVREEGDASLEDPDRNPRALWMVDVQTGDRRKLLGPDTELNGIHHAVFSLGGQFVYVLADNGVTTDQIHQVDVRTGRQKRVIDGNGLRIFRSGKWAGHLLTRRHKYFPEGGSRDPFCVVRPDGTEIFELPETGIPSISADARWLSANHVQAW